MTKIRTCIGCRKQTEKQKLVRMVLDGNKVVIDPDGKMGGRGAHVHANLACVTKALNEKLLTHRFRYKKGNFKAKQESGINELTEETQYAGNSLDMSALKKFGSGLIADGQ